MAANETDITEYLWSWTRVGKKIKTDDHSLYKYIQVQTCYSEVY